MISPVFGNSFPENDVEFRCPERRSDLVLHHFYFYPVAHRFFAILDLRHAPDIQPDRSIEFQRVASRRRLRIAEHDADLFPQLVDKNTNGIGLADRSGKLSQSL